MCNICNWFRASKLVERVLRYDAVSYVAEVVSHCFLAIHLSWSAYKEDEKEYFPFGQPRTKTRYPMRIQLRIVRSLMAWCKVENTEILELFNASYEVLHQFDLVHMISSILINFLACLGWMFFGCAWVCTRGEISVWCLCLYDAIICCLAQISERETYIRLETHVPFIGDRRTRLFSFPQCMSIPQYRHF